MHLFHNPRLAALKPALLLALLLAAFCSPPARAAEPRVSLARHAAQTPALRGARLLGRLAADTPLHFALILPLRHQAALDTLLRRQYAPGDALYGHFLTSSSSSARRRKTTKRSRPGRSHRAWPSPAPMPAAQSWMSPGRPGRWRPRLRFG